MDMTDKKRQYGNTVVLVEGHDRRMMVREAIGRLEDGFRSRVEQAGRIFIHPNLVSYHRQTANTDSELVRGVLDHLSLTTDEKVVVGDAGVRPTKTAFERLGYDTLSRSGNVELVDLNEDETVPSYAYTAQMKKKPIGFSRRVAGSDFVIVAVPAKMHHYFGVTLSVKTQVVGSMIVKASPLGHHARWPWVLTGHYPGNHTLADVFADHPAHMAVIDGTQAMEGNGPASGRTVNLGWLAVSFNPVAADAVAAYLLGWEPGDIGYLYYLHRKGWGPIDPRKMEIVGANYRRLRRRLKKPDSYPDMLNWKEKARSPLGGRVSNALALLKQSLRL